MAKWYDKVEMGGGKREYAHRLRAEMALGRPLRGTETVHHADGTKSKTSMLVICPDQAYHLFLHVRTRAVRAGGNPDTEKWCNQCKTCKPFTAFGSRPGGLAPWCQVCRTTRWKTNQAARLARGHVPQPVKTHCTHGHEFTEETTYIGKDGYRECRACHRNQENARRKRS